MHSVENVLQACQQRYCDYCLT